MHRSNQRPSYSSSSIVLIVGIGLALACSDKKPTVPPKEQVVWAKVNDTPVTQFDVEQAAKRTLGALAVETVQRAAAAKLLDSAIQSRALAMAAERELNQDERFTLEKEVAVYREQLLVRNYIERHTPPAPVTPEMVADYYQKHPERFGGGTENQYELLGANRAVSPDERKTFLAKLQDAANKKDWKAWGSDLTDAGLPAAFSTGALSDKLLHPKLRELLTTLSSDKTSSVVFVEGRPYVARITGKQTKPARPLDEVRADIVRALSPVQLSNAVEKAAAEVMKRTKVERLKGAPSAEAALQAGSATPSAGAVK